MKKFLIIATTFALISPIIVITMYIVTMPSNQEMVSYTLGIDALEGKVLSNYETHGIHGEGETCIVLYFKEDSALLKTIKENKNWQQTPFNHAMLALLYGCQTKEIKIAPLLVNKNSKPFIPLITDGYYLLLDKYNQPYPSQESLYGLNGYPIDVTVGVYNPKTQLLYYCESD